MKGNVFFDTNILIYAFAKNDPRAEIAENLILAGGIIGVQTLNEFTAVAMRKLAMPWAEVLEALGALRTLFPAPVPITLKIHDAALRIVSRYGYHIYDSLLIAAALESGCHTLFSEDMREGQLIDGLTIRNPF